MFNLRVELTKIIGNFSACFTADLSAEIPLTTISHGY